MATVSPFRAIHFDPAKVGDLTKVVAPPYDVISPEEQLRLHERHPKNIVRIDFGLEQAGDDGKENKYSRAARMYEEWLREGTLVRDRAPGLYYYTQEFTIPGRGKFVRKGFLGALRLSAFGEGEVFPHEKTLSGPKVDRLALMRVTNANMSPIFGLFSDPADDVLKALRKGAAKEPDLVATDDIGVIHRIWTVTDPACLSAAVAAMKDKGVFIADGHHRYETALAFRDEMRAKHGAGDPSKAYEHVLMFLGNMDDEGILILPTHRGIHSLPSFSEEAFVAKVRERLAVVTREGSPDDAIRAVEEIGTREKAVAFSAGGGRYHLVTFPDVEKFADEKLARFPKELRTLDVVLLHGYLLEELLGITPEAVTAGQFVKYYKEPAKAMKELKAGEVQVAFFMNGVTVKEFKVVSLSGHVLPQKSTFFYPKIGTGLLVNPLGADERLPG
jgi:uncharacterized protein (DUF1015 family)